MLRGLALPRPVLLPRPGNNSSVLLSLFQFLLSHPDPKFRCLTLEGWVIPLEEDSSSFDKKLLDQFRDDNPTIIEQRERHFSFKLAHPPSASFEVKISRESDYLLSYEHVIRE